jgi:hypothetical protein
MPGSVAVAVSPPPVLTGDMAGCKVTLVPAPRQPSALQATAPRKEITAATAAQKHQA